MGYSRRMTGTIVPEVAVCAACGHAPPAGSRYCNMCGAALAQKAARASAQSQVEQRWIYIDLYDLKLPAHFDSLDERADAVSHLYERFAPFADEGWEWEVHPADHKFAGWLYQAGRGGLWVAGAELLCRRVTYPGSAARVLDTHHHLSDHRRGQLVRRLWTTN